MADNANVLKEYVVGLGFQVDEPQMRKAASALQDLLNSITISLAASGNEVAAFFTGLASAVIGAGVAIDHAVDKISGNFEQMYYSAQKSGTSVGNLRAIESAAQHIGLQAGTAAQQVEQLGLALKFDPGKQSLMRSLGIVTEGKDSTEAFLALMERLQKMQTQVGPYVAQQYAQRYFDISQTQFAQYMANLPRLQAQYARFKDTEKKSGLDPEKAAEDLVKYRNAVKDVGEQFQRLSVIVLDRVTPGLTKLNAALSNWLTRIEKSQRVNELLDRAGESLHKLFAVLNDHKEDIWKATIDGFDLLDKALVEIGQDIDFIVKLVDKLKWLDKHTPSWLKDPAATGGAAGGAVHDFTKGLFHESETPASGSEQAGQALKQGWLDPWLGGAAKLGKLWQDGVDAFTQANNDFIKANEGYTPTAKDDVGHLAIGYGHQIRPGEEALAGGISRDKAEELFQQDVGAARRYVLTRTKGVKLNEQMLGALTDLVYNMGGLGKAPTLRNALKNGDYEKAAKAFELYDMAGGLHNKGLRARRLQDEALFRSGMRQQFGDKAGASGAQVSFHQDTKITVHGAGEPAAVGRRVASEQARVNKDAVRNLQTRTA